MSKEVSQIEVGKSEIVVAHKMVHDGVSSVVVTEAGKVVGIVTRLDLYAAIIDNGPDWQARGCLKRVGMGGQGPSRQRLVEFPYA